MSAPTPAAGAAPDMPPGPERLDRVRLDALGRTGLLDDVPHEALDRLTRLASQLLAVPVSLVSLVGFDRQSFASVVGPAEPWATRRGTPLSHSFCRHVVESGAPLVVTDARRDPVAARQRHDRRPGGDRLRRDAPHPVER